MYSIVVAVVVAQRVVAELEPELLVALVVVAVDDAEHW